MLRFHLPCTFENCHGTMYRAPTDNQSRILADRWVCDRCHREDTLWSAKKATGSLPDDDRDVIVHCKTEVFAQANIHQEVWSVWVGLEKRFTVLQGREEAIFLGIALGAELQRPVWIDEGVFPPKRLIVTDGSQFTIEERQG